MKFDGSLVEKCLKELSYPDEKIPPRPILVSGAYEQNILDMDTAEIRQATSKDLVALTKLADSYEMLGSAPVRPMNLPPRVAEIAMYKVSWENSSRRCNSILEANPKPSIKVANYVYEMSKVVNKSFSIGIWINSSPVGGHDAYCRSECSHPYDRSLCSKYGRAFCWLYHA